MLVKVTVHFDQILNNTQGTPFIANAGLAAAEVKAETVEPPKLKQMSLPSRALAAVATQLKLYTAAKEQHLLVVADKTATAAPDAASDEKLVQQWQVRALKCLVATSRQNRCVACLFKGCHASVYTPFLQHLALLCIGLAFTILKQKMQQQHLNRIWGHDSNVPNMTAYVLVKCANSEPCFTEECGASFLFLMMKFDGVAVVNSSVHPCAEHY